MKPRQRWRRTLVLLALVFFSLLQLVFVAYVMEVLERPSYAEGDFASLLAQLPLFARPALEPDLSGVDLAHADDISSDSTASILPALYTDGLEQLDTDMLDRAESNSQSLLTSTHRKPLPRTAAQQEMDAQHGSALWPKHGEVETEGTALSALNPVAGPHSMLALSRPAHSADGAHSSSKDRGHANARWAGGSRSQSVPAQHAVEEKAQHVGGKHRWQHEYTAFSIEKSLQWDFGETNVKAGSVDLLGCIGTGTGGVGVASCGNTHRSGVGMLCPVTPVGFQIEGVHLAQAHTGWYSTARLSMA